MKKKIGWVLIGSLVMIMIVGCTSEKHQHDTELVVLQAKIERFSVTPIGFDSTGLNPQELQMISLLVQASRLMDSLFLMQVYAGNPEIIQKLESKDCEYYQALRRYFNIMFGPFDRLDHNQPFIGKQSKPKGANFYPEDMTKEELTQWIAAHPELESDFISEFSVIRRDSSGLVAIPYAEYYRSHLDKVVTLMRQAAELAENPSFKHYLLTRAADFIKNDYFESDVAWMDLKDSKFDLVIGPYEVYEDELFNYKAAFEAFLCMTDSLESAKLEQFAAFIPEIEKNLPLPQKDKQYQRGSESPIVVANLIYSAGDTKAGVQTLAFNLPNDERVRARKGSKKVMLKNIHQAKFEKILKPIGQAILPPDQQPALTFESFFNHTLMHEISHGVGPGVIEVDGRKSEVKKELKETYSKIEECKADVLGMTNNILLLDRGVYPEDYERQIWVTFLANIFRSTRFGIGEAHGASNAIILNYVLEQGGYVYDQTTQTVGVDFSKIRQAMQQLAADILRIEAAGDYQAALKMIETYAVDSPPLVQLRSKLQSIPVDITPAFQIEKTGI
ncbi:MAG: peptidase [Candidatus Delongbacteria bacterium]|nr:peptidase [Candidatus Delongbacteria bacterium]